MLLRLSPFVRLSSCCCLLPRGTIFCTPSPPALSPTATIYTASTGSPARIAPRPAHHSSPTRDSVPSDIPELPFDYPEGVLRLCAADACLCSTASTIVRSSSSSIALTSLRFSAMNTAVMVLAAQHSLPTRRRRRRHRIEAALVRLDPQCWREPVRVASMMVTKTGPSSSRCTSGGSRRWPRMPAAALWKCVPEVSQAGTIPDHSTPGTKKAT